MEELLAEVAEMLVLFGMIDGLTPAETVLLALQLGHEIGHGCAESEVRSSVPGSYDGIMM